MNRVKVEEIHLSGEDWNQSGSFVNKPSRGWLHSNEKILGSGVTYVLKYLGCIEVLRSMRSLDFNTRTQITRKLSCITGNVRLISLRPPHPTPLLAIAF
uniref:PID domain-containing protein n=1 Tax=Callorhinchus milii TaxID=7868 RepID=A0A4W3I9Y9_CALMI